MFTPGADLWLRIALTTAGGLVLCLLLLIWVVPMTSYNTQVSLTCRTLTMTSQRARVVGSTAARELPSLGVRV
jgi:hypothetical protein